MDAYTQSLIDKYLLGQLTPEEEQALAQARSSEEVESAFQEQKDLQAVLKADARLELKAELGALVQSGETKSVVRPIHRWVWLAAAGVFILLAVGLWWGLPQGPIAQDQLFASHFQPYPNVLVILKRNGNQVPNRRAEAFLAYEARDYVQALRQFEAIQADSADQRLDFYRANCLLALDQAEAAIPVLQVLQADRSGQFAEATDWYLALAYLKAGQAKAAESALQAILVIPQHRFRDQAQALLAQQ